MFKEHDRVVLMTDMPEESLMAGDVGIIVHIHKGGEAFEVEFRTVDGDTPTVATIRKSQAGQFVEQRIANNISETRVMGLHAGSIWMSDDFDDPLPDEFWLGTESGK